MGEFIGNTKPRNPSFIKEKWNIINSIFTLLKEREMVCNVFEDKVFSLPSTKLEKLSQS